MEMISRRAFGLRPTGMRAGEILGLKLDAIDFDRGLIHIKRTYCQKQRLIKETTKTHQSRSIAMNDTTRGALLMARKQAKADVLFTPEALACTDVSHLARVLRNDCESAGVRVIRFHDLRHTFATQFVSNAGSIFHLAGILGHTTAAMTARYAHFSSDQAKAAAQIVSFGVPGSENVIPIGQNLVTPSAVRS